MVYNCLFLSERSCEVFTIITLAFAAMFMVLFFKGEKKAVLFSDRAVALFAGAVLALGALHIRKSSNEYIAAAKESYRYVVCVGGSDAGTYAVNDLLMEADGSVSLVYEVPDKKHKGKRVLETCRGSCNYVWDFGKNRTLTRTELAVFEKPWVLLKIGNSGA